MFKSMVLVLSVSSAVASAATIVPFERDVPRIEEYSSISASNNDSTNYRTEFGADDNDQWYYTGFTIQNAGPNAIVPTAPTEVNFAARDFNFQTDDHSKRETYLWITDYNGSGKISDYLETVMYFLPRENQIAIEELDETMNVTLTTGEEVVFSKKDKTIMSGALSEKALDYNPDQAQRKNADNTYTGKGIVLRSDAKGRDPRLGGKLSVLKKGLPPCQILNSAFWTQTGYPQFKFVSDEEAYAVIKSKCGPQYLPEN